VLFFVRQTVLRQAQKIAAAIDFERLDETTRGSWARLPRELEILVWSLAVHPGWEPARSWVTRHTGELTILTPGLTAVAPEAVATRLRDGFSLRLDVASGLGWGFAEVGRSRLAAVDQELAVRVLDENRADIAQGFAKLGPSDCAEIPEFLALLRKLAPTVLATSFSRVDPTIAEKHWAARLKGRAAEIKAVLALLDAAAAAPDTSSAAE
jgi:hypothetical protein